MAENIDFQLWFDFSAPASQWRKMTVKDILEVIGEHNASHARIVAVGIALTRLVGESKMSNGRKVRLMPPPALY